MGINSTFNSGDIKHNKKILFVIRVKGVVRKIPFCNRRVKNGTGNSRFSNYALVMWLIEAQNKKCFRHLKCIRNSQNYTQPYA